MELRDKLSLKADLEIAREIQFSLVPASPFIREGVHIHCRMRPANTVGGDYYDIIELGDPDRLAIVIGDVAGKGMPAALLMALLQGSLRTLVSAGHRGPELIAGLNRYLCSTIPDNSLVTLFYGELELRTGRLRYVNAGHNAPFLLRNDGAVERLHATSLVLGVLDQSDFPAAETQVAPGDQVLLFTDGVVEAMNPRDEEFGDDRLSEFLRQRAKMAQPELLAALTEAVLAHSGERRPHDDMTLMSVVRA
jgi:serine phosphatase RsbU (regulator of sigma subunit)